MNSTTRTINFNLGYHREGSRKDPVRAIGELCKDNVSSLFLGRSGSGKTAKAQQAALQLSKKGETVLIIDLRNTMSPDQIYPPISDEFEAHANRLDTYTTPIYCSLLSPVTYSDGTEEQACDVAGAVANTCSACFRFGVAQNSFLLDAIERSIEDGSYSRNGFSAIGGKLLSNEKAAITVKQRLHVLLQHNVFRDGPFFLKEASINVLDLSKYDAISQRVIAELVLYHVWHQISTGNGHPMFICIDEFQNIGIGRDGVLSKMASEGRKFGLNLLLLTQSLGIHFNDSQRKLLCQANYKYFFQPSDADLNQFASLLGGNGDVDTKAALKHLRVGECIVTGPVFVGTSTVPETDPILLTSDVLNLQSDSENDDPSVD